MIQIETSLKKITDAILKIGANPVIVGGYVRDSIMGYSSKDIDIEVFGVDSLESLENILAPFGSTNVVGKSFGVLKLTTKEYQLDISMPRTEIKTGIKHKDFSVKTDGNLTFKEAALRRDFKMNALGFDLRSEEIVDPFDGLKDIENKIISHINDKTFTEDPLRILRAIGFAARFNFKISQKTKDLCKNMVKEGELLHLSKERIFEEVKKILLKTKKPSIAFYLADELGINESIFTEIEALKGVKQRAKYHPEGDVFTHTMMALDVMAQYNEKNRLALMFAVLCHDFGKAQTTKLIDGEYRAHGHEAVSVHLAQNFMSRLTDDKALIETILPLVRYHGEPKKFYESKVSDSAIRRLANKVNISLLVEVSRADTLGRTTKDAKSGNFDAKEWLLKRAGELKVKSSAPKKILQGRDLIEQGLTPSKEFKKILDLAFEAQMDGEFLNIEDGKIWLKKYLA